MLRSYKIGTYKVIQFLAFLFLLGLTTNINAATAGYNNKFQINYLDDSNNPLALEQMVTLPDQMYASVKDGLHKPQSLDFSVWYKIKLNPQTMALTEPFTITVDNPSLDFIRFYLIKDGEVTQEKTVGDTQYSDSGVDYVVPQIRIFDDFDASHIVYIHVKTNGASATPIIIESVADSELRSAAQLMLLGCFIGVVLIMVIYNYFMFRGIGDPSYVNYIGYIIFAGLTLSMINGFTFFILPYELAKWMNSHVLIAHFCGLAFAVRFAISFLRFNRVKPWFIQWGIMLSRLGFAFAISALFFSEGTLTPFYFMCVGLVYLYAIVLMAKVIGEKVIWIKYYLASWIPLFVGVGVGIAAFNGGVEYNFFTRNAAVIGILSEICLMSMALMDRFRVNELDKDYKTHHDEVTGLPNRIALSLVMEKLINNKKMFTLSLFEINESDALFSNLGVTKANKLYQELFSNVEEYTEGLSSVYKFNRNIQSEEHHVIRINQSRFAVVFVGDLSEQTLEYNVMVIQEAVSTILHIDGAAISPSCTAALVTYPVDCLDKEQVLFLAHQTLLVAYQERRSCLKYRDLTHATTNVQFELAGQLQRAIANNDLQLFHQPQMSFTTGKVVGSELLLRWNHNELGYVETARLIEVAESIGMINELTEWVLNKSFEQHSKLLKLGFEHTASINLSAKDLQDNSLMAQILTATVEYNVPPETVIFEITEKATVDEHALLSDIAKELTEQGYKIAVDDFGAGYSNLAKLAQLPLSQIKLDQSLMDLDRNHIKRTVVEDIVSLCSKLGVQVVAEGMETESAKELLKSFHCDLGQGYYYAKPMAFLDYMRWLQTKPQS